MAAEAKPRFTGFSARAVRSVSVSDFDRVSDLEDGGEGEELRDVALVRAVADVALDMNEWREPSRSWSRRHWSWDVALVDMEDASTE